MDAPKCRLCGKRHWGVCATVKADPGIMVNRAESNPVGMVNNMVNRAVIEPDMVNSMVNKPVGMVNGSEGKPSYKYRDAEKRRVYIRDKMREMRQRQRDTQATTAPAGAAQ